MEIGTPANSQITNVLNIDNNELLALGGSFKSIVFGHKDGLHAAAQSGLVRIGAVNMAEQPSLRSNVEVYGSSITVEDYSRSDYTLLIGGDLKLDAVNDVTLRNRVEARSDAGLQDITLYSATGTVSQTDAAVGDGIAGEALRGDHLTVTAVTGISLLHTELNTVTAVNSGGGSNGISISETALGGSLSVLGATQTATGGAGAIEISTRAGTLTVAPAADTGIGVRNAGHGSITLTSSAGAIAVQQAVTTNTGSITLQASGQITTSGAGR
ncbi:hypothetical protein HK414_15950 [Ramlibacter terrae]|uniref:Adhesin domain-containing protein n=1 Tax=Ramlibacter terrae TaxID=2732511 RepID=A0ABX6P4I8_9BURK|nr:hypothetical protein HK414_15950 [Ramlibacter terrae]